MQSPGFVISKKVFWCFLIFTLFNAGLAAANIHYSLRVSESLREYREEDLSSLRRIDPFSGNYIPSSSGEQPFYNKKASENAAAKHSFYRSCLLKRV
ncbi:hypothetical protein HYPSUDRAFT_43949 [Hypholoma sublateritium FD-334 SS-4]|uniref:Uncharacterized protein n=1 Tax=Hypholoma sublateritium (strain FD-334 SS-4) TaxID=945553 RepID=A0A0D2PII5_HYPSF|nr:hypothetical protein HYPSUDRAFT_43949 [Hypholoma sublateritium FD-334 SS-4]